MIRMLALAFMLMTSMAWGYGFTPHERLANSKFPVEIGKVEYDAANNMTLIHGRCMNLTGIEQPDVAMQMNFYRNNAPIGSVVTDLGHMYNKSYAYFHIVVRNVDLTGSTSYGVKVKSTLEPALHEQPAGVWDGYAHATTGSPGIVTYDQAFPIRELHVDPYRYHQGSKVEGMIENHSNQPINNTWFKLSFYDQQGRFMAVIPLHVRHIEPGDTAIFSEHSNRDDLRNWSSYVLQLDPDHHEAVSAETYTAGYTVAQPARVVQQPVIAPAPAPTAVAKHPAYVPPRYLVQPGYSVQPGVEVREGEAVQPGYAINANHPVLLGNSRHDFRLNELAITHDHSTGRAIKVNGQIENHSGTNIPSVTHLTAVFFDKDRRRIGSMNFNVPKLTNGDSTYFTTEQVQGNFTHNSPYQLFLTK